MQTGLALAGVTVEPGLHALAGGAHRGSDVRFGPTALMPLDHQQPTVECGAGISVDTRTSE